MYRSTHGLSWLDAGDAWAQSSEHRDELWRGWSSELRDALGGCDWVNLEINFGGRYRVNLEIHLKTVIERVWRCSWWPWSSEHSDALGPVIEWTSRYTWSPWSWTWRCQLGGVNLEVWTWRCELGGVNLGGGTWRCELGGVKLWGGTWRWSSWKRSICRRSI